ncbi:MAG: DEAD/DEAH box helicase [Candidatus Methanofastidiosia archaeon]
MIVLHALWNSSAGCLCVWAESSATIRPGTGEHSGNMHPFALERDALVQEVAKFLPDSRGEIMELEIYLPSNSGRPLPSPQCSLQVPMNEGPIQLLSWKIPAVILDPCSALDFLLHLPVSPPHGVNYGSSLRFWMEAASFLLELLCKQWAIPTMEKSDKTKFRAHWEVLISDKNQEQFQLLSEAMPPVCRAFSLSGKIPSAILLDFLNKNVDAFIKTNVSLQSDSWYQPALLSGTVAEKWTYGLLTEKVVISAPAKQIEPFSRQLSSWIDRVKPDSAPLRLCFKLDPPDNGQDSWALKFYLQARDDRSILIPAQKIWSVRSDVVTFVKRTFENPQERLLIELGKASRLYLPLDESLRSPHPVGMDLTAEKAYTFLQQSASLLVESGFGVLLPPWWQSPQTRLGVKLTVKQPPRTVGKGLLGINSILAYEWQVAIGDDLLSTEEFKELAQLKVPLVKIRGKWVEVRPDDIKKAVAFFEKTKYNGEMRLGDALRLSLEQGISEVGLPVVDVEAKGKIKSLFQSLLTSKISHFTPPETFHGTLRPYQVKGVSWLWFLNTVGLGGCLADDMGLGKTIQVIALLLHERVEGTPGPTLIVCPMSVVGNWYKEIERFAPSLKVMVHHGQERVTTSLVDAVRQHDVVITTYALVHRDESDIASVPWERVVLDEAQNIKNPWAKRTQAAKRLKANQRIALTGTPVENRLSELWSIMDFLNRNYLGSHEEFRKRFALPIERYHDSHSTELLKKLATPFLLRRLKTDKSIIRDLPEKMEMRVFCNLSREQATLYEAVVQEMMDKIKDSEGIQRKGLVLSTLMKLKQVCNHPAQFLHDKSSLKGRSGKLERLEEMLEEVVAEGDKALIFTQFREMGVILQQHLQEALDCEILFLHGGTSKKQRDNMIEHFQKTERVPLFVLSLKAGGLGLNLTAANHVFHFDRWWNPAVENQATDRAFRIGQVKNVQVHKFVCLGTVEERIDEMIEEKKGLAERIVGAGEGWITEMSAAELKNLFALTSTVGGG